MSICGLFSQNLIHLQHNVRHVVWTTDTRSQLLLRFQGQGSYFLYHFRDVTKMFK